VVEGQDKKYSLNILIDKEDRETLARIQKAYEEAVQEGIEKFGQSFKGKVTPLKKAPGVGSRGIITDCDADEKFSAPEFKNKYMLSAKSNRPVSVGYRKNGVTYAYSSKEEIEENVYSGCYGAINFNLYPYTTVGTGIAAGLNSVLKVKDGEPLGGHSSVTADFGDASEFDDETGSDDLSALL
jgi:hypothetical protein